ncbi:MAG: RIP metalloprotease RseP [Candidatus Spechtbacteria bacterium]|nr:RIP metalloprotease RseP [Candidatus Spechtbacteria bacterium]
MILTIVILVVAFSLLVFVHELGHFVVAKLAGAKVEEFGFGFPPRVYGVKRGETIYSINALPFGGFVRIMGESGEEAQNPESFASKPIWARALVIAAGVTMNVFLAFVLYTGGHIVGLPTIIESDSQAAQARDVHVQIIEVVPNSPASQAGIQMGDVIDRIAIPPTWIEPWLAGIKIDSVDDVKNIIDQNKGHEIHVEILRGSQHLSISVTPRENPPAGEGALGIGMIRSGIISYPWYAAVWQGAQTTFYNLGALAQGFWQLISGIFTTGKLSADIAGPVGVAHLVYQVSNLGFIYVLQFVAFLSLNLAIINVIPFPALDGGRLLFIVIEAIKGSPVNKKFENAAHIVGFALLILLTIVITIRDVAKLF